MTINNLKTATKYEVTVAAVTNLHSDDGGDEGLSADTTVTMYTAPESPTQPTVQASYSSASVVWRQSPQIAEGAKVEEYIVEYSRIDKAGDVIHTQTISSNKTAALIKDLVEGFHYSFGVKVYIKHVNCRM